MDTYANLQLALLDEIDIEGTNLETAMPNMIARAEAKINRTLRLDKMEQLSYATWDSTTDRRWPYPDDMVEMLSLRVKVAGEDDSEYRRMRYIEPAEFHKYYKPAGAPEYYTLRKNGEFDKVADATYTMEMHYLKKWSLADEGTGINWLLTNHPDIYMYGSMAEVEMYERNPQNVVGWKSIFEQAMKELNDNNHKSHNDATLDTADVSAVGNFDVVRGDW